MTISMKKVVLKMHSQGIHCLDINMLKLDVKLNELVYAKYALISNIGPPDILAQPD